MNTNLHEQGGKSVVYCPPEIYISEIRTHKILSDSYDPFIPEEDIS